MVVAVIGISMDHTAVPERAVLRDVYYEAVAAAGGLPLLVPPVLDSRVLEAALERVDALLMPGGDDYHPALWGDEHLDPRCSLVTARRQEADCRILRIALQRRMPLLAICGSMQALNVVCGGSVIQHLPQTPAHRARSDELPARHPVTVSPGSLLARLTGRSRFSVNSYHHQGCGTIAPGLRVSARAPDGVVEAIESVRPDAFILGVQWHPEKAIDESPHRALFEGLVAAAARNAERTRG